MRHQVLRMGRAGASVGLAALVMVGVPGWIWNRGIDLTKAEAGKVIKETYGYPRRVMISIPVRSEYGTDVASDIVINTPSSKGPDMSNAAETLEGLLDHAIERGWLVVRRDSDGMGYSVAVTPRGGQLWHRDGDDLVAPFGISRFRGVTGVHGAVGAAEYAVTYGDEIELAEEWKGARGAALEDNRLTGSLTVSLYRYSNGWRAQVGF